MALVLVMAMVLSCTGCGEELIPLTDSEREQIVHFSAHIIGEFNKSQTEGYTALNKRQLQAIYSEEETESNQDQSIEEDSSETGTVQGQDTTSAESPAETVSLTEALGIDGITAQCTGYKVQKDYVQDDVFAMTATEGKRYVVLTIKLENETSAKRTCDVAGQKKAFSLNVNDGSYTAAALITFLPNDFGAFSDEIAGGKTKKTVLLFEVPEDTAKNISGLRLEVDNGTTKQTILIN